MSFDHAFAERVLEQIRTVLKKRGADGVRGLMRNFKICDGDGSGQLNEEELAKCFRLCKLTLSPAEMMSLFRFFDKNGNGLVSFDEFIKTVRGKMNQPRRNLVVKAFRTLDAAGDNSGSLTVEDIRPFFNAGQDPRVKDGTKTEAEVLTEFIAGFEGKGGNFDGTVTLEEWIDYYEDISSSIDEDDLFGTMFESSWSRLKTKDKQGNVMPAINYVSEGDMNMLEDILVKNIYQKSQGVNVERALRNAFKQFDADGSGEVEFREFRLAMERFGLTMASPDSRSKGGVPYEVLRGLFDRYNKDQSESLSYQEFSDGLFKKEQEITLHEDAGENEQGGQNPWLPSLAHQVSMDPHYQRPRSAQPAVRIRSIANRAPNSLGPPGNWA